MQAEARSEIHSMDNATTQYATFFIGNRLYGIDVQSVQEVVTSLPITIVPLAQQHIIGLINLRGQVATAIGLREIFNLPSDASSNMNVVCSAENMLLSFIVDEIGDVVEVEKSSYEETPSTIAESTRRFLRGIYKTNSQLLSVIDLASICKHLGLSSKE